MRVDGQRMPSPDRDLASSIEQLVMVTTTDVQECYGCCAAAWGSPKRTGVWQVLKIASLRRQ